MTHDRLVIKNSEHQTSICQAVAKSRDVRSAYHRGLADVTFHAAGGKTVRAHRVILASVSEVLADVFDRYFPDAPLEEDVHVSLADIDFDAFKIVLGFAYGGVADIPRASVESVCEVAQQLRIKFLKDCFVKINQKEYQEIKAGKKTLKDVHPTPTPPTTPSSNVIGQKSPNRSRSGSKSPTKGKNGSVKSGKGNATTQSDTDSADSDDENGREFKRKQEEIKKGGKPKSKASSSTSAYYMEASFSNYTFNSRCKGSRRVNWARKKQKATGLGVSQQNHVHPCETDGGRQVEEEGGGQRITPTTRPL